MVFFLFGSHIYKLELCTYVWIVIASCNRDNLLDNTKIRTQHIFLYYIPLQRTVIILVYI